MDYGFDINGIVGMDFLKSVWLVLQIWFLVTLMRIEKGYSIKSLFKMLLHLK
jgi:hypothetical protein